MPDCLIPCYRSAGDLHEELDRLGQADGPNAEINSEMSRVSLSDVEMAG